MSAVFLNTFFAALYGRPKPAGHQITITYLPSTSTGSATGSYSGSMQWQNSLRRFMMPSTSPCAMPLGGSCTTESFSSTPSTTYPPPMLSMSFANAHMV